MVRALALDTAAEGIRFNASAGPTMWHRLWLWLCSDEARFITGQNILVDGGYAIPGHRAG